LKPSLTLMTLVLLIGSCSSGPAVSPQALQAKIQALGGDGQVHGERLLEPQAVAKFYESRQYQPAWTGGSKAEDVVKAIRGVENDGLDPSAYHLETIQALIEKPGTEDDAVDLELLLADAMAGAVDHMRYGRVQPVKLNPAWNMDPRDGAPPLEATLHDLASSSPSTALEKARPDHFIYQGLVGALAGLRKIEAEGGWPTVPAGKAIKPRTRDRRIPAVRARLAASGELKSAAAGDSTLYDAPLIEAVKLFQARHRLDATGLIGKGTFEAMNVPVGVRIDQVRANLERARWVLSGLQGDFLLVNLPAFKTYLIEGGKNVWESRIQVGQEGRQTPSFRAVLKTIVFNPDWTVPPTILDEDVLQGMREGKDVLAEKKLMVFDANNQPVDPSSVDWDTASADAFPYTLRQPPGLDNALGRVKFLFPNKFSIYLHDTPHRELFTAQSRTFSSGCIRVERPLELAQRLLAGQWTNDQIQDALADPSKTKYVNLQRDLPIVIVYWTVSVGASGEVRYAGDVYGLDAPLAAALGTAKTAQTP
jgi:murein L,D-transpeptidase YcbB/YkuD